MKLKKVVLEVRTWQGYGGIHWYGCLVWYDDNRHSSEIEYRLNKKQADRFNYLEPGAYKPYNVGDTSLRFDDLEQLYDAGVNLCLQKHGKNVVLFKGQSASVSPQLCLYAPVESLKNALNELYEKAKRIGWYDGDHKKEMYDIDDQWQALSEEWQIGA